MPQLGLVRRGMVDSGRGLPQQSRAEVVQRRRLLKHNRLIMVGRSGRTRSLVAIDAAAGEKLRERRVLLNGIYSIVNGNARIVFFLFRSSLPRSLSSLHPILADFRPRKG